MLRGGEEIARLRRVVGGLFGDIVAAGPIGVIPVAGEGLSQNGIEWLFHSPAYPSVFIAGYLDWTWNIRRFDVPSTQIEFHHGDKAFDGVINC